MNLSRDKLQVFYIYCNFLPLKQTYKIFLFASAIADLGFRTVVKYRKIPCASGANQIVENAWIPHAADLQKNKRHLCYGIEGESTMLASLHH